MPATESTEFFYFVPEQQTHGKKKINNSKNKAKNNKKQKKSGGHSQSHTNSLTRPTSFTHGSSAQNNQRVSGNDNNNKKKLSSHNKKKSSIRLSKTTQGGGTSSPSSFWRWFMCSCGSNANKDIVTSSQPTELNNHATSQSSISFEDDSRMQPKSSTEDLRDEGEEDDHSEIFRQLEDAGQTILDGSSEFGAHGMNSSRNTSAYATFGPDENSNPNSRNVSIYRMVSDDSGASPHLEYSNDTRLEYSTDNDSRMDIPNLPVVRVTSQAPSLPNESMLSTSSSYDGHNPHSNPNHLHYSHNHHHTHNLGITLESKSTSLEAILGDHDETTGKPMSPAVRELLRSSVRTEAMVPITSTTTTSHQPHHPIEENLPTTSTADGNYNNSHGHSNQSNFEYASMTTEPHIILPANDHIAPMVYNPTSTTHHSSHSHSNSTGNSSNTTTTNSSAGAITKKPSFTTTSYRQPLNARTGGSFDIPEVTSADYECESGDSDAGSQSISLSIQSSVFDGSLAPSLQVTPIANGHTTHGGGFFRANSFHDSSPNMSRASSAVISPPQSYYGSGSGWAVAGSGQSVGLVSTQQQSRASGHSSSSNNLTGTRGSSGNNSLTGTMNYERPVSSGASVVSSASMEQAIQASLEEERRRREQEIVYRRAVEQALQQSLAENAAPSREHYDLMQHRLHLEQQRRIHLLQAMARQYDDIAGTAGEGAASVSDAGSCSYAGNSDTSINSATIVVGGINQEPSVYGSYGYYR